MAMDGSTDTQQSEGFDFTARYKVEGEGGIAWYAVHYEKVYDEDYEWTGIEGENKERVVCIMVGDDREFTFDVEDLVKLDDGDYCTECGQLGCKGDGR